ncbi:hypothetical protein EV361DRAFT_871580 [Lentinula raphanica]|nr:hypothetical protein EV361DRAFT_871580 [Lentinula raphanica]
MQVDRLIHPSIPKCLLILYGPWPIWPHWCILAWSYHFNSSLWSSMASTCTMYDYLVTNFGNLLHLEQEFEISLFTEYGSITIALPVYVETFTGIFLSLKELIGLKIILILVEFTTVLVYAVRGSIQIKKFAQISVESKVNL